MEWFPDQRDGGLNRFYFDLLRYLPQVGVDVRGIVAGSKSVATSSHGTVRAFAPATMPIYRRLSRVRGTVRRALRQGDVSLVASHFALYTFPVLDMLRPWPLVIHFQGPWAAENQIEGQRSAATLLRAAVERMVYRQGSAFIVLSRAFGDVLHREYGVRPERIHVVPPGVEVDRFAIECGRWEARQRLGWPQDRPTVLVVRRLTRRMGIENLLAAISSVRRRVPDVLLCVAGTGPLAAALAEQVVSLGLKQNVRLLGFVSEDDLPYAYRAADLTIVPTIALEGFGLVTIESLSAGTPVLVTPVDGLPEAVGALSANLVLPGSGPDALADGLTAALSGSLCLPDADACRAFARTHYDWPVIARRVRAVYAQAAR